MKTLVVLASLIAHAAAAGNDDDRGLRCEEIKQKIRVIQSKMRAGYTRSQGEKMEEDLRAAARAALESLPLAAEPTEILRKHLHVA